MATTKITSNVLADGAALSNLNSGASIAFTKNLSTTGNATVTGNLLVDTNTLFVDATNNRVGIGTLTPSDTLSISGTLSASGNITGNRLLYGSDTTTGILFNTGTIFLNTAGSTKLIINSAGNVGIGTASPNERLTISGNLSASGDAYANGFKLASENFAVAMAIALG